MTTTNNASNSSNRIRQIFLERKPRYSLSDLIRLTGITRYAVTTGIKAGEYVAERERGQFRFNWTELAHIAMAKWPLPVINDALGADAVRVLPPLLLLQELRVRLPAYQVLMLHRLAALESVDVDSYLANYSSISPGRRSPFSTWRSRVSRRRCASRMEGDDMPLTRRSFVQTVSLLFGAESFSPRALEPHEQIEMQVAFGLREGRRHV